MRWERNRSGWDEIKWNRRQIWSCSLDLDPTQASEAPWARGISRSRRVREKRIGDELEDMRRIDSIRSTDIGSQPDSTKVLRQPKSRLRFVQQWNDTGCLVSLSLYHADRPIYIAEQV